MNPDSPNDAKIIQSWRKNVAPWVSAVREGRIESRRQSTDAAIVEAVIERAPVSVLDVGCGEGWLARALSARGVQVMGIDAGPELVEAARPVGGGDFQVISYEELTAGKFRASVDVAVCNFSLLGKESTEGVMRAVPALLNPGGAFIVQTLHPVGACGELPYRDGWRAGSWTGFGPEFTDPAPWYFRTLESWAALFADCGFRLLERREPLNPETGRPASVIFISVPT